MAAKQAMKEKLWCTSKYVHLRISQDICHVRMTDIEGFLTIYGPRNNLLNNNICYSANYFSGLEINLRWKYNVCEIAPSCWEF